VISQSNITHAGRWHMGPAGTIHMVQEIIFFGGLLGGDWNIGEMYGLMMVTLW